MRERSSGAVLAHGILIGVVIGGVGAILALTLLIPTNEFRVRMWLLLENPGDFSLHLALLAAFSVTGLITLRMMRAWRTLTVLGVVVGAALQVAALSMGMYRWMPEFHSMLGRAAVSTSVFFLGAMLLWRQQRPWRDAVSAPVDPAREPVALSSMEGLHTPPTVPWRRDHDRTA